MQPYFFPYIGYWQLMKMVDKYVIYDDVNYIKGGWINRNNFLINREKKMFTITLNSPSPYKLINEIEIKDDFKKFLKMIYLNYSKAPYYKDFFPIVESICNFQEKNLASFLANSFREILSYLNIQTDLLLSSSLSKDMSLKGQDKVLHICKLLNASIYVNAVGGQELYSKEDFSKYNVDLKFIQSETVSYKQFGDIFIPNLSILDLLMFNSPVEVNQMLDQYKLI